VAEKAMSDDDNFDDFDVSDDVDFDEGDRRSEPASPQRLTGTSSHAGMRVDENR
jgi:hypothetical protein